MKRTKKSEQLAMFAAPVAEPEKAAPVVRDLAPEAERLLANFEVLAEAPGGVKRLRELVLALAVSGRLVKQESTDEPASVLMMHIEAEKHRRIESGTLRNMKSLSTISDEESAVPLPVNWVWVRMGQVVKLWNGFAFKSNDFCENGIPVIRIGDLQGGKIDTSSAVCVSQDVATALSAEYWIPEGALLIAMSGATTGKVAINMTGKRVLLNQRVGRLEPILIGSDYVRLFLETIVTRNLSISSGSAIPNLSAEQINQTILALPPLAEQKRIVAKVDELMKLCDELEARQAKERETGARLTKAALEALANAEGPEEVAANWERVVGNFEGLISRAEDVKTVRETVLSLAVRGRLVKQDPRDEPATDLLLRLNQRRSALLREGHPNPEEASVQLRKQASQVLPEGLEPLPTGWAWTTLIQASLLLVDCHNKTAPYTDSGIRLLRTTNVRNGQLNLSEPKFVSESTYERWSARCKPEPGDIIITREAPMGEACIIPAGMKVCLGQRMMLIRTIPQMIDTTYLLYSLMSPDLMDRVQDKPVGATVQHLRVGGVETLLTPIPPLAEQKRIVAKVDQLMALCDELEMALRQTEDTSRKVAEALVAELVQPKPAA